jgi:hypothetical protein
VPLEYGRNAKNRIYEALVLELGLSRSELYTKALKIYLRKYNRDALGNHWKWYRILTKLNQVYAEEPNALDPVLSKMQFMSLPREDW